MRSNIHANDVTAAVTFINVKQVSMLTPVMLSLGLGLGLKTEFFGLGLES